MTEHDEDKKHEDKDEAESAPSAPAPLDPEAPGDIPDPGKHG